MQKMHPPAGCDEGGAADFGLLKEFGRAAEEAKVRLEE
jgi:hypothetical protein